MNLNESHVTIQESLPDALRTHFTWVTFRSYGSFHSQVTSTQPLGDHDLEHVRDCDSKLIAISWLRRSYSYPLTVKVLLGRLKLKGIRLLNSAILKRHYCVPFALLRSFAEIFCQLLASGLPQIQTSLCTRALWARTKLLSLSRSLDA